MRLFCLLVRYVYVSNAYERRLFSRLGSVTSHPSLGLKKHAHTLCVCRPKQLQVRYVGCKEESREGSKNGYLLSLRTAAQTAPCKQDNQTGPEALFQHI